MFSVFSINLSEDFAHAGVVFGKRELGEMDAAALGGWLEKFLKVDAMENFESEPRVLVSGKGGKFSIQMEHGKLFAHDARDSSQPPFEILPNELGVLDGAPASAPIRDDGTSLDVPVPAEGNRTLAIALTVLAVCVNAYTAYSFFGDTSPKVDDLKGVVFVADPQTASVQAGTMAGTYATGSTLGDRVMVIHSGGTAEFSVVQQPGRETETYRAAVENGKPCLVTDQKGVIRPLDHDTVEFYRDIYHRTKTAP